jgi:hypothetical protein
MKIYSGFTVAADRSAVEADRKVVELLEEMGHDVLTRHLVSDNAWEVDRPISPRTYSGAIWAGSNSVSSSSQKCQGRLLDWD